LEFIATSSTDVQYELRGLDLSFIKEVNVYVDALVNIVCDESFTLMLYDHCPAQINMLGLADLIGVYSLCIVRR